MSALERKTIRDFYNEVYSSGDIRDNIRQYRWIIRLVRAPPVKPKILDVGCGVGYLLAEALRKNIGAFGLDLSWSALKKGKFRFPSMYVCVANGEYIPFKSEIFDVVFSLGSLEHFLHPEGGLQEMRRVLKEQGRAILVLPNSFSLYTILKVFRQGRPEGQWQIQEKILTKEEWRGLIEKNGFTVEKVLKYSKYPELFQEGTLRLKSLKKYFENLLMRMFCPLNFAWQFAFICRKP